MPEAAQHTKNIQFALLEYHLAIVLVVKEVPLEFSPRNDHVLALCSIEGKAISQWPSLNGSCVILYNTVVMISGDGPVQDKIICLQNKLWSGRNSKRGRIVNINEKQKAA